MIDPELLEAFQKESNEILIQLKAIMDKLEEAQDAFPSELLQDFSQKIDRIMGAAKTIGMEDPSHLGFRHIGALAELCKHIGYKAADKKQLSLLPIFVAFWSDVIGVTEELLDSLDDLSRAEEITKDFAPILVKRLEWLKKKVSNGDAVDSSQQAIDKVLESLSRGRD